MRTQTLIPRCRPTVAEFQRFIESCPGGAWAEAVGIPRGVIEAERGHLYVDYDDQYGRYFAEYLPEAQRAHILANLDGPPTLALHLHASVVDSGSDELADTIREQILQRWGGVMED